MRSSSKGSGGICCRISEVVCLLTVGVAGCVQDSRYADIWIASAVFKNSCNDLPDTCIMELPGV